MIDEKSQGWINAFKTVTICLFIIFLLGGLIGGLADAGGSGGALDLGLGGDDDGFADFIMWIIPCWVIGIIQLVVNMLLVQLLNNIQIIRMKIEKWDINEERK